MAKQFKSDALASVYETALGLEDAGVIAKQTMRAFDEMRLTPVEDLSPEEILEIRLNEKACQAVFARYLNVTTGLVSQLKAQADRFAKNEYGAYLRGL